MKKKGNLKCISCFNCIHDPHEVCENAIKCYHLKVIEREKGFYIAKGCFTDEKDNFLNCKNKSQILNKNGSEYGFAGICCDDKDFCNDIQTSYTYLYLIILSIFILILVFLFLFRRKHKYDDFNIDENTIFDLIKAEEGFSKDITSGSGAGYPLMSERTMIKEIVLEYQIGKGRFGEVWKSDFKDKKVAVKKFFSTDYASWERENEIYSLYSLGHESILKFLGSDISSSEACTTEYWIVFDYHELGSLYDFLHINKLNKKQVISIIYSAISGLFHLHDLHEFTISKPGIAHRDLKSKNLLMKSYKTVCIADFGLSVTSKGIETGQYKNIKNVRVGTKRYMPPEILSETLNVVDFNAFRMADIYSFSLIMWEILNCSELNKNYSTYKLPYNEFVGDDPSFDEMKKVVYLDNQRPSLPSENLIKTSNDNLINDKQFFYKLCNLIECCWNSDPNLRFDYIKLRTNFVTILKLENL